MITDLLQELKQVSELKRIPETQLQWLAEKGQVNSFIDGQKIFSKGDIIDSLRILLRGEVNFFVEQAGTCGMWKQLRRERLPANFHTLG